MDDAWDTSWGTISRKLLPESGTAIVPTRAPGRLEIAVNDLAIAASPAPAILCVHIGHIRQQPHAHPHACNDNMKDHQGASAGHVVPRCRLVGQRESRTLNRSSDVQRSASSLPSAHDVAEQLAQLGEGAAQRAVLEEQVDQVLVGTVQRVAQLVDRVKCRRLAKVGPDMNSTVMAHLVLLIARRTP